MTGLPGRIAQLTPDDLPACLGLAVDRKWPSEERKWRLLLDVGTGFGMRDGAGDLIGTTVMTRYGLDMAAISMVLVASRWGGRGIGRALMSHALSEAGNATLFLYATDQGMPLYRKLGFAHARTVYTHHGPFAPSAAPVAERSGESVTRPARVTDLAAIFALDQQVIGANRVQVLCQLPSFATQLHVVEDHGSISGYSAAWDNLNHAVIGPVIAATAEQARQLISDLASLVPGPVRVDLDDRHPRLRRWASRHGLRPRNATALMIRGGSLSGDRSRWFCPFMQALG